MFCRIGLFKSGGDFLWGWERVELSVLLQEYF